MAYRPKKVGRFFYLLLFFTLGTLCLDWFVSKKGVVNPDFVSVKARRQFRG
jgi:hypothetical protein